MKYPETTIAWHLRLTAAFLMPLQFLSGNAVAITGFAQSFQPLVQTKIATVPVESATKIKLGNGSTATPALPPLHFSNAPTDQEISGVILFQEHLCVIGNKTTPPEDQDLANALSNYFASRNKANVSVFTNFLKKYPESGWKLSLLVDLGLIERQYGLYSRALETWDTAWNLAKAEKSTQAQALANRAVSELIRLLSTLGRTERLKPLLDEVRNRPMYGTPATLILNAREALGMMQSSPGRTFKCGPYALGNVQAALHPKSPIDPIVYKSKSSTKGFSLAQLTEMAQAMKLNLQAAKRQAGADFLTPAVINWKSGHYAALIKKEGDAYLVKDPTFGKDRIFSKEALEDESSGYFLVRAGSLPAGWSKVTADEAGTVWGRGYEGPSTPTATTCKDCNTGCGGQTPMTSYSIFLLLACLHLEDTPVGYHPPIGPDVRLTVGYNQYEMGQTGAFTTSNFGNNWVFNWMSYVSQAVTPTSSSTQTVVLQGGGSESYSGYTSLTGIYNGFYAPQAQGQQTLYVLQTANPARASDPNQWRYERHEPDGSMEVYDSPSDSAGNVYLTQIIDPQQNAVTITYVGVQIGAQSFYRIHTITDAINQQTTYGYDEVTGHGVNDDPLKVTQVTDPFGRTANFYYSTASPHQLISITDVFGIQSSFGYTAGSDAITSLTTPYGTTRFAASITDNAGTYGHHTRSLIVTLPDGSQEQVISMNEVSNLPAEAALPDPSTVAYAQGDNKTFLAPSTMSSFEYYNQNTYYWNRRAMAESGGGLQHLSTAHAYHWLVDGVNSANGAGPIPFSQKPALENRVWCNYARDPQYNAPWYLGMSDKPTAMARLRSDGTTQLTQFSYDAFGQITQSIDAKGRITKYSYVDPNDTTNTETLNLYKVTQGTANDVLMTATYNSQHEPLTITDASGQVTHYWYNGQGQLTAIKDALNNITNFTYTGRNGTGSGNFLTKITSPVVGTDPARTTTFTYDNVGHVATKTDSQGYTISYIYDEIDRVKTITYPDASTELIVYQNLDPLRVTDRHGQVTRLFYDSLRQLVGQEDSHGTVTNYQWCSCGALGSLVDGNGHKTSWARDLEGRPQVKTYPDGTTTTCVFDTAINRINTKTDANQFGTSSVTTTYGYDLDDAVLQTSYSDGTPTVNFTYDGTYPRLLTFADTQTGTTTLTYNPVNGTVGSGQLQKVSNTVLGTSADLTYVYDKLGRVITRQVNGTANSITTTFDALGRIGSQANLLGTFNIGYLSNTDRVQSIGLTGGPSTQFSYLDNAHDQRLGEIKNLNSASAVVSKFDYQYDILGRITQKIEQADSASPTTWTYGYDPVGELLSAVRKTSSTTLTVASYGYDAGGNRLSTQTNGTVTSQAYNAANQPGATSVGGSLLWQGHTDKALYSVTLNGQPATISNATNFAGTVPVTAGANTVTVVAEDTTANVRTNQFQSVVGGAAAAAPTYDYRGNLLSDTTRTYTWDARNELTAINYVSPAPQKMSGTIIGTPGTHGGSNTCDKALDGNAATYFFGPDATGDYVGLDLGWNAMPVTQVKYLSISGSGSYMVGGQFQGSNTADFSSGVATLATISTAPADGVMTSLAVTGASTYRYVRYLSPTGGWCKVAEVEFDGPSITQTAMTYDGLGRRTKIVELVGSTMVSTKQFVWDGLSLVEERDASGNITKRFYAQGEQINGTSFLFTRDYLGSIRELTDLTGTVVTRLEYDSWGVLSVISGYVMPDQGYAGMYLHQPSGQYQTKWRIYDPQTARWLSKDPMGEGADATLYSYVGNDPINGFDPLGLMAIDSVTAEVEAAIARGDATAIQEALDTYGPTIKPALQAEARAALAGITRAAIKQGVNAAVQAAAKCAGSQATKIAALGAALTKLAQQYGAQFSSLQLQGGVQGYIGVAARPGGPIPAVFVGPDGSVYSGKLQELVINGVNGNLGYLSQFALRNPR